METNPSPDPSTHDPDEYFFSVVMLHVHGMINVEELQDEYGDEDQLRADVRRVIELSGEWDKTPSSAPTIAARWWEFTWAYDWRRDCCSDCGGLFTPENPLSHCSNERDFFAPDMYHKGCGR